MVSGEIHVGEEQAASFPSIRSYLLTQHSMTSHNAIHNAKCATMPNVQQVFSGEFLAIFRTLLGHKASTKIAQLALSTFINGIYTPVLNKEMEPKILLHIWHC